MIAIMDWKKLRKGRKMIKFEQLQKDTRFMFHGKQYVVTKLIMDGKTVKRVIAVPDSKN